MVIDSANPTVKSCATHPPRAEENADLVQIVVFLERYARSRRIRQAHPCRVPLFFRLCPSEHGTVLARARPLDRIARARLARLAAVLIRRPALAARHRFLDGHPHRVNQTVCLSSDRTLARAVN